MTVNDEGSLGGDTPGSGASTTAVADGGAVVSTMPANRVAGTVKVNLLPPELAEERTFRKIQVGAAAAVAVAAGLVVLLYVQQSSKLDDAKHDLSVAQADNARLTQEQARLGNVDALFKQVDAADAMLASAQAYEIHMSSYLDELSLRQPPNIYFSSVTITEAPGGIALPVAGAVAAPATATTASAPAVASPVLGSAAGSLGTISITGTGFKHSDVANWLESFSQMSGVTGVYLGSSSEALVGTGSSSVATVGWTSTAQLTLAALAPKPVPGATS